ncbi:MAG: hypothetical protein GY835_22505 [bacterium]|nr:hypothetical protein [bacterium]
MRVLRLKDAIAKELEHVDALRKKAIKKWGVKKDNGEYTMPEPQTENFDKLDSHFLELASIKVPISVRNKIVISTDVPCATSVLELYKAFITVVVPPGQDEEEFDVEEDEGDDSPEAVTGDEETESSEETAVEESSVAMELDALREAVADVGGGGDNGSGDAPTLKVDKRDNRKRKRKRRRRRQPN